MPQKVLETPYPLIDADPHAGRVLRYMRPSDLVAWGGMTAGFPAALYAWDMADPLKMPKGMVLRVGGVAGFLGGFLLAYQRSSFRFWGWTENKREQELDFAELSQRAKEGKPLYGESHQPQWVQHAAYSNSVFSQLKFAAIPWFNLVNHPHHGTDASKYKPESSDDSS